MRLSKFSKKMIAFISAIALVVAGIVYAPASASADVDPSTLDYTTVTSGDNTIGYSVVEQNIEGWATPWYGDGGITFQCVYAGGAVNPAEDTTVKVNDVETTSGVVTLIGAGLVKLNPTLMDDDAYTHVVITAKTGSADMYIKKGDPSGPTTEAPSVDPSTEAPSVDPSTEAPTEETTEAPTEETTEAPTGTIDTNGGWLARKADGSFEVGSGVTYNVDGISAIYAGNWGDKDANIRVSQNSTDPYSVPINVLNTSQNDEWLTQVCYKVSDLDTSKTYKITLKAGDTVLNEKTVNNVASYQFCAGTGWALAAGETTLTLDVKEESKPEPPVVQDITITPNEAQIEANRNIWASWTNPDTTEKAYAYLKQADAGYDVIAANGWDFNTQAGQPMTAVDQVNHTKNNEITIEEGGTYTFIVETFDAWNQPTGRGSVDITIPGLTPEEKEAKEYLGKINTEENLALHKTPIVGSHDNTAANIVDGNSASMWQADKTVDNTTFAVDLESVVTVDKVLVSWEASNARAYEIYLAGEDQDYSTTPVATVSGLPNNTAVYRLSKDINTEARYVKVVVTEWSSNAENYGIAPYELAVFGKGEEPTSEQPTSEEPSTEAPSTEAPTQVPGVMTALTPENFTVVEEIVEEGKVTGRWFQVSGYEVYVGYWNDSTGQATVYADDQDHIQAQQLSSNWWGEWAFQIRKTVTGLKAGEEYTLTINMNASEANGTYCTSSDPTLVSVQAGDQTITIKGTADDNGTVKFNVGAGYVGTAVVMDFSNPVVKDSSGTQVYPAVEPTTEAPTETTTEAPTETTTEAPTETTTEAPTTTAEPTTIAPTTQKPTEAPTTVAPTKLPDPVPVIKIPDKAKVKKAIKKKKSAKKIKIKLAKVKGAKGYQVQVSKKKKGKALVKKYTTKTKLTIKSKKFKKKKKLYVKVRAYTLDGTIKIFGAWSKPKKTTKK